MRTTSRGLLAFSIGSVGLVLLANPALAGIITTPNTNPFTVPRNGAGTGPATFTIRVRGYAPGSTVWAMICDGTPSTARGWDPTINCDNGTSPAGAAVRPDGTATFDATNKNFQIGVFDGLSPSANFNCLFPGQADPGNGNPSWGSNVALPNGGGSAGCQLRVASTNAAVTGDQAMITLILPKLACVRNCQAAASQTPVGQTPGASAASLAGPVNPTASASVQAGSAGARSRGPLAYTGDDNRRLFLIGMRLIVCGLLLFAVSWIRGWRAEAMMSD